MSNSDVNISNCDDEPIHLLGDVQSFGCLIGFSIDWVVTHVSENVEQFLAIKVNDILEREVSTLVSNDCLHDFRRALQTATVTGSSGRLFNVTLNQNMSTLFDASIHMSQDTIIVELEYAKNRLPDELTSTAQWMLKRLNAELSLTELLNKAAKQIRMTTGYERVMVYRFLPDESGEVVAESTSPNVDSFYGLRFPASDIPKQARALYAKQLLRIIAGVDDVRSPIVTRRKDKTPLDLSFSICRAVSPIHLEYLKNMGVNGSLSISIMVNGKLWGLFACHHNQPKYISFEIRTLLEFYAEIFSLKLSVRQQEDENDYEKQARKIHDKLIQSIDMDAPSFESIKNQLPLLKGLVTCDGVGLWLDGKYAFEGTSLQLEEMTGLVNYLKSQPASEIYSLDSIFSVIPTAEAYAKRAAGMLAISLSRQAKDFLIFFRKALPEGVKWAGNPEKPMELGKNGIRLTPRKSFDVWVEHNSYACEPWKSIDMYLVKSLRVTMLEMLLKLINDKEQLRKDAQNKQDVLISELNHRVKNILALMNAVVALTDNNTKTKAEFKQLLDGRVKAIGYAQEQLTVSNWAPISLTQLLLNEANIYSNDSSRIHILGDDALLSPDSVTCIVLVIHEMFTNAAKYGALSNSKGVIEIDCHINNDAALEIKWSEIGGPVVSTPSRVGFGSTIINRSIPHELNGTSSLTFFPKGLEAVFCIPAKHVKRLGKELEVIEATPEQHLMNTLSDFDSILFVEDNLMIALDVENILAELGFNHIHLTSNASDSLDYIKSSPPSCAILDFHLGTETSALVAQELFDKKIPFIFASGYGNQLRVPKHLQAIHVISKPYDKNLIEQALLNLKTN